MDWSWWFSSRGGARRCRRWVRHRVSLDVGARDERSAQIDETSWRERSEWCRKRGFSPRRLRPRCGLRERKRRANKMKGVVRTGIPTSAPYDECREHAMPSSRAAYFAFMGVCGCSAGARELAFPLVTWHGVVIAACRSARRSGPGEVQGRCGPPVGQSGLEPARKAPTRSGFGCSRAVGEPAVAGTRVRDRAAVAAAADDPAGQPAHLAAGADAAVPRQPPCRFGSAPRSPPH
jgi:hypothetical protein